MPSEWYDLASHLHRSRLSLDYNNWHLRKFPPGGKLHSENRASAVEDVRWVIRTWKRSGSTSMSKCSRNPPCWRDTGNSFLQLFCWFSFLISWKLPQKGSMIWHSLSLGYVHDLPAFFGAFGKSANLTFDQVVRFEQDVKRQKLPA